MRRFGQKGLILICALMITLSAIVGNSVNYVTASVKTARPSVNGALHVEGTYLVDEHHEVVDLRGLSTHGLTWYPEFINKSLFQFISDDWQCNFMRLAMYSSLYCGKEKKENLALMKKGIDAAIAADMYVLVDWHILDDYDPNINIKQAKAFFEEISKTYANVPNIIYEICNEPNGKTTWADITKYADVIIPAIRANSPQSICIVGTPDYDKALMVAAISPLPYENIMYTCHFYTASHYDVLFSELKAAIESEVPVFITECGLSEASGDGGTDFENAAVWFSYLKTHHIGYAIWSMSNKPETSAMVKPSVTSPKSLRDKDLTQVGLWVRELIRGKDPATIVAVEESHTSIIDRLHALVLKAGPSGIKAAHHWPVLAVIALVLIIASIVIGSFYRKKNHQGGKYTTYDDYLNAKNVHHHVSFRQLIVRLVILISTFLSLLYIGWRLFYSIPFKYGIHAIVANIILLLVETLGFVETLIHYDSMMNMRSHPLPHIEKDEYPDVDIFIATYNEPVDLLKRTINGCLHLRYPDKDKVHIWICDDNRRPEMRALAESMGVGYFDRPDNKGAKAGNLNHAMGLTSAPYIVTFDADMIPRSSFLLKTIPYFVDLEKHNATLPEDKRISLGLLQTPQCFYDPDVFQHALHSERRAPNEQDFFYRTVEVAKTATNSVIYGGSNTVLSRQALNAVGGFYTESITEDFATGMLIESAGFISLALSEPLASGRTPHTFKEHIQQRTRWGRGVLVTARQLKLLRRPGLSLTQKLSYWSSVVYWYSPIKNLIYMLSPLLFAVFAIPVFRCTWLELLMFWLPMFIFQDISLRLVSGNAVSTKWSGIYETSVMPHLLIPIIKESLGITLSAFKVTDKSGTGTKRQIDIRSMIPFIVLIILSIIGIVRILLLIKGIESVGLFILLFWLIRNLYYLLMALFLVDGRDSDGEPVHVYDAEGVIIEKDGRILEGITTHLTEHSMQVFLDLGGKLRIGDHVNITVDTGHYQAHLTGAVIGEREIHSSRQSLYTIEILDFNDDYGEYLEVLFDRIPTLPQNLNRDLGIISHLWINIAHRLGRV